jgi:error-prone DNA polymerase
MPMPPGEKRRPIPPALRSRDAPPAQPFAELCSRTNYSFLSAASHPDELVNRAAELGLSALAITDDHSVAGVVRAHVAAKAVGLKLLIGAEVEPLGCSRAVVLAANRNGYAHLCRLLTRGRTAAEKGDCRIVWDDVVQHSDDLLVLVMLDVTSPRPDDWRRWKELFGDRAYAIGSLHKRPHDEWLLKRLQGMAESASLPLVASNQVLYHDRQRRFLQDVVTGIRLGATVANLGEHRLPNGERYLKSGRAMAELWQEAPNAVARTVEVADRCQFSLDELKYDYPKELCPGSETPLSYLSRLTWDGAEDRYPDGVPAKVRNQIEYELKLIEELRYEAYFLTVWDLVRFARSRGILCQGRGSAANSAVCYCLGVTSVDPDRMDVLFERFISRERDEAPDIDIDFEHQRREEVIQYVYEKYGRERAGMTAEVITYRPRSAVRDVGKALGLSLDRVDTLAKSVDHVDTSEKLAQRFQEAGVDPESRVIQQLIYLVREILGFPRHLSQHVGGMVLTHGPLCELVPIENASMPGRTVIQWDKDDLDALGILKVDCLALGMLSAIRRGLDLIHEHTGRRYTLASIPAEDPAVYAMIQKADTIGVFQIESRAQMSMLPRLKPKEFYDLVIEVAIVRPGPIQGDMVHPFLKRRMGQEKVEYPSKDVEEVLRRTLGVPLFQEQAMRLVTVAAGFTPGEADQLRRAMGAWRKTGVIEKFRVKLLSGMAANGYTAEFAERLYKQICGFGQYGFPESHAASFALLVYASAWIKRHHPAVFLASLLNSQPMGFYAPSQLVTDARNHGVEVRPVDVTASVWDCTLETVENGLPTVRLGLRMVRGMSEAWAKQIVVARGGSCFVSYGDFVRRTRVPTDVAANLSRANAFRSIEPDRRQAVWQSLAANDAAPLFDGSPDPEPAAPLMPMTPQQEMVGDYLTTGLYLQSHPFLFLREQLAARGVVTAASLATQKPDRRYSIAGLIILRQRPGTAKGITFMTLEDETGTANLIVRIEVWERFHKVARHSAGMIVTGRLQNHESVIHLVVERMEDLSPMIADVNSSSRDFR